MQGRGGLSKTRSLEEVPHLDAAAVEARALVEVERRPAGDGRRAWSSPPSETCGRVRATASTVHTWPAPEIAGPYPSKP